MSHALMCRRLSLSALVLCLLMAGCGKTVNHHVADARDKLSFQFGERWVIRPAKPINATRIEITRDIVAAADEQAEGDDEKTQDKQTRTQMLRIDLTNGRAVLEIEGGDVYPQQLTSEDVRRIHQLIAERGWQVRSIGPAEGAESFAAYQLTVYEIDQAVKDRPIWHVPAKRELPEVFRVLTDTFDVADRYAYPLSDDVNLLE